MNTVCTKRNACSKSRKSLANNGDFVELFLNGKFLQRVETVLYSITPCTLLYQPGDELEIWVMMHDVGRVNGIGWPVHWLYTTKAEIDALDAKTAREWQYCLYKPESL